MLLHGGGAHRPVLKSVPFAGELAKTGEQKAAIGLLFASTAFGRPIVAPPDMSADRVKMLQDAFAATIADPEFLAEAKKQKVDVEPQDGATLATLIRHVYATPKPIVDTVVELIK
jgi:hypothetical protein